MSLGYYYNNKTNKWNESLLFTMTQASSRESPHPPPTLSKFLHGAGEGGTFPDCHFLWKVVL